MTILWENFEDDKFILKNTETKIKRVVIVQKTKPEATNIHYYKIKMATEPSFLFKWSLSILSLKLDKLSDFSESK